MEPSQEPAGSRQAALAVGVLVLLGLSGLALAVAPALMAESYSWVEHTTSESAAQGEPGAWLARTGFVLFGVAVVLLAVAARRSWRLAGTVLLGAFGVFMVGAAIFSTRSWEPTAAFDPTEDTLHSVAASAMGVAFALGVVCVLVVRHAEGRGPGVIGPVAVAASIGLPLAMAAWEPISGVLQRIMFAVAYLWYASEALRLATPGRTGILAPPRHGRCG